MTYKQRITLQGFTLVELSIVIIIIGFLIAGIAAGQSLIRQASLNSVISDMQSYKVAYNTFVVRYQGVPGDIPNGGSYFPTCSDSSADSVTYCSGNGDGNIDQPEAYAAWRELALAGIISAGIVQVPAVVWDTTQTETLGSTIPVSKINGAGYRMISNTSDLGGSVGTTYGSPTIYVGNAVYIGKPGTLFGLGGGALSPQDAFNIDQKIDDGTIDSGGNFIGANTGEFVSSRAAGDIIPTCTTLDYGNIYDINETGLNCLSGLALN